jgi:hypothetical protein
MNRPLTMWERQNMMIEAIHASIANAKARATEEYDPSVAVSQDHRTRGNAR